jgi:hypothetical protein
VDSVGVRSTCTGRPTAGRSRSSPPNSLGSRCASPPPMAPPPARSSARARRSTGTGSILPERS